MKVEKTNIDGVFVIEPKVFGDSRGYFFESFSAKDFQDQTGMNISFVQDNESLSSKGTIRGLHFQKPPYTQAKLVRVIKGAVQDIIVDLRKNSPTYGQHFKIVLSEENKTQLFVPEGFAHGFLVLEDNTIFQYKCNKYYEPSSEGSVKWNDPQLNIEWMIDSEEEGLLSAKDKNAPSFEEFKKTNIYF